MTGAAARSMRESEGKGCGARRVESKGGQYQTHQQDCNNGAPKHQRDARKRELMHRKMMLCLRKDVIWDR